MKNSLIPIEKISIFQKLKNFFKLTFLHKNKTEPPQVVKAKLNFVLTTYYKGTGMEEVLKKLEQYVDNADKKENDITCI